MAGSTANVINRNVVQLIVGLLLVLVILVDVKVYKRSVQRRRDQHHDLEKAVAAK